MGEQGRTAIAGLCAIASLIVAACAISNESLWLDEFGTWQITQATTLSDWWRRFLAWPDSDSQIPVYHFYMYLWTKLFGTDAAAMRASNAGMFLIANLALIWPFRSRPGILFSILLAALFSAPLWYYLNEIRPYIMLYMGTCVMVGSSIEILNSASKPRPSAVTALSLGAVVSCGATVIGVVWAGSIALFVLIYWLTVRRETLRSLLAINYVAPGLAIFVIAMLIAHYFWMYALGKLPALLESSFQTLMFSVYGVVGLLGVGPGMLDMREKGVAALVPFAPILGICAAALALLALLGLRDIRRHMGSRALAIAIGCACLPVLFIFALGLFLQWRILPRHFLPLVAPISCLYGFGMRACWRGHAPGKGVAVIGVIVMVYSALSMRFAPRHSKEDYKYASVLAAAEIANGGNVWWVADFRGALYYRLPYISPEIDGALPKYDRGVDFFVGDRTSAELSRKPAPALVVVSRPESYDRKNVVRAYLSDGKYRQTASFPGFTLWRQ